MRRLWWQAMGDQYPEQVEPSSSCSWWLLGQLVAALRLRPGSRLVDLGCGRGGTGLWLARATAARLIGIDFSAAAVALSAQRAAEFVEPGLAESRQATFEHTGLADAEVDGAVSVDALPFASDRTAALVEARRILRPGARLAFTCRPGTDGRQGWHAMAAAAGLRVEDTATVPGNEEFWRRLHGLWLAHEAELRAELSERAADNFIREATHFQERRDELPPTVLLVLRRPAGPDGSASLEQHQ
jgi:SAM-dependent methyltransferase